MSLSILQNLTAIGQNVVTPFQGAGGVEPYTYSVVSGGAGGSINASTGLYTAPNSPGIDTIQVVDSTPVTPLTASATIAVCGPLSLVVDVLRQNLSLASDQVYLYNQKFIIPPDSRLYISVGFLRFKPFGRSNQFDGVGSGLSTLESINIGSTLNIEMFSKSTAALDRLGEMIISLDSTYSRSQQEANNFRLFPISTSLVNLSLIDGIAIPYRFHMAVNMQFTVSKVVTPAYYDNFPGFTVIENT